MQSNLSQKVPNFSGEGYSSESLAEQLRTLRGRELPGFMSVRLLLATASTDIDLWRVEVENAISRVVEIYQKTALVLVNKLAMQVISLTHSLTHSLTYLLTYLLTHSISIRILLML